MTLNNNDLIFTGLKKEAQEIEPLLKIIAPKSEIFNNPILFTLQVFISAYWRILDLQELCFQHLPDIFLG